MSKQDEAGLILKLYELRRDPIMREARDWFFREFHPTSAADWADTTFGPHGAHLRMVTSYWEMAAALVNNGAIDVKLFTETNGEHIGVFSRIEKIIPELRAQMGPQVFSQLEKLIDDTPKGRERVAQAHEMMKMIRARMEQQKKNA